MNSVGLSHNGRDPLSKYEIFYKARMIVICAHIPQKRKLCIWAKTAPFGGSTRFVLWGGRQLPFLWSLDTPLLSFTSLLLGGCDASSRSLSLLFYCVHSSVPPLSFPPLAPLGVLCTFTYNLNQQNICSTFFLSRRIHEECFWGLRTSQAKWKWWCYEK